MPRPSPLLSALLVAGLAACAHHGLSPHRPEGGPPPGDRPARPQLFVSPWGQPYRAPSGAAYPVQAWFAETDADHDGRITRVEFVAGADRFFDVLDTRKDGLIRGDEVSVYEETIVPEMLPRVAAGPGPEPGFPGGPGGMGGHRKGGGMGGDFKKGGKGHRGGGYQGVAPYALLNEPHPVRGADADLSQSVTRDEFKAAASRRFAMLDTDQDGALTAAELPLTPIQSLFADGSRRTGR
ncbi:hypothetical protein [Caulobacter sp. 17J80-11]|uniref:hypothetical protein n=1 Tax=Caulobacter sp. 17J80-11 TaxID=2763502 RepID=UPI001653C712|nr:hypothetical protein [Caulobacter sp. 17J80-11]MBC6981847.1 hypothetical protein [Caulobacter sp. 17J80-11]